MQAFFLNEIPTIQACKVEPKYGNCRIWASLATNSYYELYIPELEYLVYDDN